MGSDVRVAWSSPTVTERRMIALLHLLGPLTMVVTALALVLGSGYGVAGVVGFVEDPVMSLLGLYATGWSFLTAVVVGCLALTVYAVTWGWRGTSAYVRGEVNAWLRFELIHAGIVFAAPAVMWIVVFLTFFVGMIVVLPVMLAWPFVYVVCRLGSALAVLSTTAPAPRPIEVHHPTAPPPGPLERRILWLVAALVGLASAAMVVASVAWAPWLLLGVAPLSLVFALAALALSDAARDPGRPGTR